MQIGKLKDNVLRRSVTNIIGKGLAENASPGVGRDFAAIDTPSGIMCIASAVGKSDGFGARAAVYKAANNIWASGAEISGMEDVIFLPEDFEEQGLKELIRSIMDACTKCGTRIIGGHTEVFHEIKQPLISVMAVGTLAERWEEEILPGDCIVETRWIGLEQMALWLSDREITEALERQFSKSYIDSVRNCSEWLSVREEAETAIKSGAKLMHDVSDGGIFGALFELSERLRMGFDIDFKAIPVRQEIMEASTFLKVNPYRMKSAGSLLVVCNDGKNMVDKITDIGIPACIIGRFTDNNDKIIRNGEDVSFLARK